MKKIFSTLFVTGSLAFGAQAAATSYPERPVTLVVPFVAGGAFDVVARMTADKVGNELGKPIIVENKPGAGGTLGGRLVSQTKPDGYTLLLSGVGPISIAPAVYPNLGYVPTNVLAPIIQLTSSPFVLTTSMTFKGDTVQDLITLLKESPGKYNYSSTGNGTLVHLAGEYFQNQTQTEALHIPYGGGGQAALSLMSDDSLFSITNIPNVQSQVKANQLRAIATTGTTRSTAFPDVPTMQESGLDEFELTGWIGIFAPAGTPDEVIQKVNTAFSVAMNDTKIQELLRNQGDVVATGPVDDFKAFLINSNTIWADIANSANVSLD